MTGPFQNTLRLLEELTSADSDGAFVAFASPEKRCLGIVKKFAGYTPKVICVIRIEDEPNEDRETNIKEIIGLVGDVAPVVNIPAQHGDVVYGIDHLVRTIAKSCGTLGKITVDISAFPKAHLLIVLRALSRMAEVQQIRIVYTEPAGYKKSLQDPMSYGVRRVAVVPTFTASYRANQDLAFIAFLGYERDRALGMWQSIEPNRTIAIIGKPSYQQEWEGKVETLNAALLAGLDDAAIHHVDPRSPLATFELLKKIIQPETVSATNFYIAPLGTKPQTVGVHYFCTQYPDAATVAYASPLEHNAEYISQGIGHSWELPRPRGHK